MASQHYLYLDTPTRGRIRLYPGSVTGVADSTRTDYQVVVYHGLYHAADVHLTDHEAAEFVALMWGPHECRLKPCYGRREARTVPDGCVGCLLRKVLYEQGFADLREALQAPPSPWPLTIAVVGSLFGFMWLVTQAQRTEGIRHAAEVRELRQENAALRAKGATFKRQAAKEKR